MPSWSVPLKQRQGRKLPPPGFQLTVTPRKAASGGHDPLAPDIHGCADWWTAWDYSLGLLQMQQHML